MDRLLRVLALLVLAPLAAAHIAWSEALCPRDARGDWHSWFAWRPVLVAGKPVWLRRVERRAGCTRDLISHRRWFYR